MKNKINKALFIGIGVLLIIAITLSILIMVKLSKDGSNPSDGSSSTATSLASLPAFSPFSSPSPSPEPITYEEMTLLSTGDIIYHGPQLNSAKKSDTGEYDFTENMKYVSSVVSKADYAVVNLEVTLGGASRDYQGYPTFNSPDSALASIKGAGFDMLLMANNHRYDLGHSGFLRTQRVAAEYGLDYIGTKQTAEEKSYKIIEINGIRIGMMNYTYETGDEGEAVKFLNGIRIDSGDTALIDSFNYNRKDRFYKEVEARMAELEAQGADALVMYLHWGNEYHLEADNEQKEIAQSLCNLGIDAIIGGHPHVIEPVEVFEAEASQHKMICFYSVGNFLSNQNRLSLTGAGLLSTQNSAYTENGAMVLLTFRKYSDGKTIISDVDYISTWVHRHKMSGRLVYEIIPLKYALEDPEGYGLYESDFGLDHAAVAAEMTKACLLEGIEKYKSRIIFPYGDEASAA